MEEERIARALARIEAAAKRVEAAASASNAPKADPDLTANHANLRREAWAALAEIDSLIETIDA